MDHSGWGGKKYFIQKNSWQGWFMRPPDQAFDAGQKKGRDRPGVYPPYNKVEGVWHVAIEALPTLLMSFLCLAVRHARNSAGVARESAGARIFTALNCVRISPQTGCFRWSRGIMKPPGVFAAEENLLTSQLFRST